MAKPEFQFYNAEDLHAANNMLTIQQAKFKAAINQGDWPGCCRSLRALSEEAENAVNIAAALSLHAHVQAMRDPDGARFRRAGGDRP